MVHFGGEYVVLVVNCAWWDHKMHSDNTCEVFGSHFDISFEIVYINLIKRTNMRVKEYAKLKNMTTFGLSKANYH